MMVSMLSRCMLTLLATVIGASLADTITSCPSQPTYQVTNNGTQYSVCSNTDYQIYSTNIINGIASTDACANECASTLGCTKAVFDKSYSVCHLKGDPDASSIRWAADTRFDVIQIASRQAQGSMITSCALQRTNLTTSGTTYSVCMFSDYQVPSFKIIGQVSSVEACAGLCISTSGCFKAVHDRIDSVCHLKQYPKVALTQWTVSSRYHAIQMGPSLTLISRYGNDAVWYQDRIPIFESADKQLTDVYYYRWKLFRAHQRDLGQRGYISTEFLNDVGWQLNPWASLNDASGFHVQEGRWLRDRRFTEDYLNFMYDVGNDRHFTDYMADSAYAKYLVDGDVAAVTRNLAAMVNLYNQWNDHFDNSKGLYYIEPLLDATEYTISSVDASGGRDGFTGGTAFRPSINSYMYANARAIARISTLAGNSAQTTSFNQLADTIKSRFQKDIWNTTLTHFIDRFQYTNQYVSYYAPIRGRELVGFVPWMFSLPDNNQVYSQAWKHILSSKELQGAKGLRTVEPTYQYYMRQYRYEGTAPECQWNGPSWPYQTTQVLTGLANLLDTYTQSVIKRSDYMQILRQYAQQHYQNGQLDLMEDYNPDTGNVIVGLDRSHHYFHSGYTDLILSGLVGIRPQPDGTIVINPMIDSTLAWFRVQKVPYHGHLLEVVWDSTGKQFNLGVGLRLIVDGQQVAQSATLTRLTTRITNVGNPAIDRPIAQSIQLSQGQAPYPDASSSNDADTLHQALDGRVWFFDTPAHGWASAPSTSATQQQWFSIDFANTVQLTRAEIAFYADGANIDVPTSYKFQILNNNVWTDIDGVQKDSPVANGITNAQWANVSTNQLRLVFQQAVGKSVRIVQLKAF